MKLPMVVEALERIAPPALAAAWDNTGLLLNPLNPRRVRRILLAIDLTEAVALEAIARRAELVVAYHPVLFHPASRLDAARPADRALMALVRRDIAVYSPHTALDAVAGGVNDWLAAGLGEAEVSVLHPQPGGTGAGQGRRVALKRPATIAAIARRMKRHLGTESLRVASPSPAKPVQSVALCAGAGTDVFEGIRADCLLTGEMGHHHVLAAVQAGAHVVLCGHTQSERGYLPVLAGSLAGALGKGIDILLSGMDRDPLQTA